jgi:hypothetical protein
MDVVPPCERRTCHAIPLACVALAVQMLSLIANMVGTSVGIQLRWVSVVSETLETGGFELGLALLSDFWSSSLGLGVS